MMPKPARTDPAAAAPGGEVGGGPEAPARRSQQRWRREREYLNAHRHDLSRLTRDLYPPSWLIAGTSLMARPEWQPPRPVPLEQVALSWRPDSVGTAVDAVRPAGSESVRPLRDDGTRFASYAAALAALNRPRLLENRTCYRLLDVSATAGAQLTFGANRYFDLINVSEAVAHETAGRVLSHPGAPLVMDELPLRSAIGDPLDLDRRSVTTGIATLILRRGRDAGSAQMFLHWRDPASVAVNGGLYQVAPAGMFQPSHEAPWNLANDLGLWEGIAREVSEELLGTGEDYGSESAPIDYPRWPFFAALTAARQAGTLRGYWLAVGADSLTLDIDMLTVLVFDASFFDRAFAGLVAANDEGHILSGPGAAGHEAGIEFSAANVHRFTSTEAMQDAGAALLRLAWQHRGVLLGG